MHHTTDRAGRVTEHLDVSTCTGCGEPFVRGLMTKSWRQCQCTPGHGGHREIHCLRDGCRGITPDPPCRGQYGATADYGGVTTHVQS